MSISPTNPNSHENNVIPLYPGVVPGEVEYLDASGEGTVQLEYLDDDQDQERGVLREVIPATFLDRTALQRRKKVAMNSLAFHAVRTPVYGARAARVAGIGVKASVRDAWSYLTAGEYGEMIRRVQTSGAGPEHVADLRAERSRVASERRHEPAVVWSLTGISTYVASVAAFGQAWSLGLLAPGLLPILGVLYVLGRREIRRNGPGDGGQTFSIVDQVDGYDPVTGQGVIGEADITAAFETAGLKGVTTIGPVAAAGPGVVVATLQLPPQITPRKALERREEIAAAFGVEPMWLDLTEAGPQKLALWLASADPFASTRENPLLDDPESAVVDITKGVPIGYNRRGEMVMLPLWQTVAILGGASQSGKGMLLRNILPALGMDTRATIRLAAGAKPGEYRCYEPILHEFVPRRPRDVVRLLEEFEAEARRREADLDEQRRAGFEASDLDKYPHEFLIIDEFQQYAISTDPVSNPEDPEKTMPSGKRIKALVESLSAFVKALNMSLVLITQDPDKDTIPRGYKSNSNTRAATRCGSATQTNAILGDGAVGSGMRAHEIKAHMKGVSIVDCDGQDGEYFRSYFINNKFPAGTPDPVAPLIAEGVRRRKAAGRLPEVETSLLDLVRDVFTKDGRPPFIPTAVLIERLGYEGSNTEFKAALRELGVDDVQGRMDDGSRPRGYRLADLPDA